MQSYLIEPVKPYSNSVFTSRNSQNVLIRQANFPQRVYESDLFASEYSDRIPEKWIAAAKKAILSSDRNPDFWNRIQEFELIAFASEIFEKNIHGARLVHFTHRVSEFPLWRLDTIVYGEHTPMRRNLSSLWEKQKISS